jgi:hypothetical protein
MFVIGTFPDLAAFRHLRGGVSGLYTEQCGSYIFMDADYGA